MKRSIFILLIILALAFSVSCASAPDAMAPEYDYPSDASTDGVFDFVWSSNDNGYYVYEKDGNDIRNVVIPSTHLGKPVVGIGKHAFGAYSRVESVFIPNSIKVIDTQAFNYCDYLKNIVYEENSGLIYISDYAFYNCKIIENINIPASVEEIGYRAFSTCPSIANLTVDEGNNYYCSENGAIYSKDMKMLVAVAPASYISNDIIPGGEASMSSLIIPEGIEVIGAGAFADCYNLDSVVIPDSVKKIEKAAFINCDNLKNIIIGESSELEIIGEGAFRDCSSLEKITIPKNVKSIGRYAFYCDNALISFNFGGTLEQWQNIEKGEKWDVNTGKYTVYCTDGEADKE